MSLAEELLDVAYRLLRPGSPSDGELRRAVSTAYYALFHATLASAADRLVGKALSASPAYQLIYRAHDHGRMQKACIAVAKRIMPGEAQAYFARASLSDASRAFAKAFVALQKARHEADYSPRSTLTKVEAQKLIDYAREGMLALAAAPEAERLDLLAFMLAQPRN